MWKISLAILLGFIILAFNYVWINRYEFVQFPNTPVIQVINKWNGQTCVLVPESSGEWDTMYQNGFVPCVHNYDRVNPNKNDAYKLP